MTSTLTAIAPVSKQKERLYRPISTTQRSLIDLQILEVHHVLAFPVYIAKHEIAEKGSATIVVTYIRITLVMLARPLALIRANPLAIWLFVALILTIFSARRGTFFAVTR